MKKIPLLEKKKYFFIHSDIFKVDIICFINYGHKEMVDFSKKINKELHIYLSHFKQDEETPADEGQIYPLTKGYAVRIKFYKNSHRKNIALVTHEITHLTQYILRKVRVPLSIDTEEVYAYLTADLLHQFLNKWY